MNSCILDLFQDQQKSTRLVTGLPKAFEMAGLELPGNLAVQKEIYEVCGPSEYLASAKSTNNRGIALKTQALVQLIEHPDTMYLVVNWVKTGLSYTPYTRWENFGTNYYRVMET